MSTRDIVLIALFAAVIVALGLVPPITLGIVPVPVTAQSLGVMLAGVVLGSRRAALSVLLVLLLCAIGMPLLSGGRGGVAVFVSPTAGYLVGFVFAAYVTGYISERSVRHDQSVMFQGTAFFVAAVAGGILVDYAAGVLWLAFATGLGIARAASATLLFVPGDIAKAAFAAFVGRKIFVLYPILLQR